MFLVESVFLFFLLKSFFYKFPPLETENPEVKVVVKLSLCAVCFGLISLMKFDERRGKNGQDLDPISTKSCLKGDQNRYSQSYHF